MEILCMFLKFLSEQIKTDFKFRDVLIEQNQIEGILDILESQNSTYSTFINDVQTLIDQEKSAISQGYSGLENFNYENYHTFEEYQSWQSDFAEENNDIVRNDGN